MKKPYSLIIIGGLMFFVLQTSSASALSFLFNTQEEGSPRVERFISSLFQSSGKTGAASVGEISALFFATTTDTFPNAMTIQTKQKSQVMAISPDTKVRRFGIPANIEDMRVGDKVSVVSSVSKTETPKLRARVISILSQAPVPANETKGKPVVTETETASSTEVKGEVKTASTTEDVISKDKGGENEGIEKEVARESVKQEKAEDKSSVKVEAARKVVK